MSFRDPLLAVLPLLAGGPEDPAEVSPGPTDRWRGCEDASVIVSFKDAAKEATLLSLYWEALGVPEEKAMHMASSYAMRRFLFRQEDIIQEVLSKCQKS